MTNNSKLIDDLLSLSGNVLGNLLGARHEMKAQARERFDHLAKQLNLVSRGEFDAAFAMLAKARMMQEELQERMQVIEAKLGVSSAKQSKAGKPYASAAPGIQHRVSSKSGIRTKTKRRLHSFRKSNNSRKRS